VVIASARTNANELRALTETEFASTNASPDLRNRTPILARARQLSEQLVEALDPPADDEGDPRGVA
jgi:hypothetical protein